MDTCINTPQIITSVSGRSILSSFGRPNFLSFVCEDIDTVWRYGHIVKDQTLTDGALFDLATNFSVLELETESVCHI